MRQICSQTYNRSIQACSFIAGFMLLLALVALPQAARAGTVMAAQGNTQYVANPALQGLNAASDTSGFSVSAWNICRYIDVATVPGGGGSKGLLVPFGSANEWRGGPDGAGQTVGFIATSHRRSYVTLDFCRPATRFEAFDYAGAGGLSDRASVVPGQDVLRTVELPQKRVDTRATDAVYNASLRDSAPPVSFNMRRDDCLHDVRYPDGSVRSPCYSWSWVEQVTASFRYDNHMTREQAKTAGRDPDNAGEGTWMPTLARTACGDLKVTSNDGRDTVTNSCPPVVTPPTLRSCPAASSGRTHWEPATYNNTQLLHDCPAGTVEGPERMRHWDTEAEYTCFDGKDYPTGATRDVHPRITGQCTPVTACANGGTPPSCAQPQCAPFTETRQSACPAGQQGGITEARQRNVGGACGIDSGWNTVGNTCAAVCQQVTETRTGACPEGQSGQVTESRVRNQGNLCNNDSAWMVTGNTCMATPVIPPVTPPVIPPVTPTCNQSVETRDGTCPAGYGGTVVERRLINVNNVCNANGNWTPYSSNCSSCTSTSTVTLNCTAAGLNGNGFVTSRTVNNTCDATRATTYTANSGCCQLGLPRGQSANVNGITVPGCD